MLRATHPRDDADDHQHAEKYQHRPHRRALARTLESCHALLPEGGMHSGSWVVGLRWSSSGPDEILRIDAVLLFD